MSGLMIAIGQPKKPGQGLAPEAGMRATGGRPAGSGASAAPASPFGGHETGAEENAEAAHMAGGTGTLTCPNCGCEYDLVKKESAPSPMHGGGAPPMDDGAPPTA